MGKRMISLFTFFCFCFGGLMMRVAYIDFSYNSSAGFINTRRNLTVGETRGKIYDRNLRKLVDSDNKLVAAVIPSTGLSEYYNFMSDMDFSDEDFQEGRPFCVETDYEINNEFIRTFTVPLRYCENQVATHLIGYLSADGKIGLSGIERACNDYLRKNSGTLTVSYEVDAKGNVLAGMDKYVNDNNFNSMSGVVLTIDKEIQVIAETALADSSIESGCVVVMQVNTGEILAMASVPSYDHNNVQDVLFEENSPLINKALQQYSVGSVFKPIVAAAALESGADEAEEYECKGVYTVGDREYSCYNSTAHGSVNMQSALEKSCNCYFINLINNIDVDYLLKLCENIGIGTADILCEGLSTATGNLPDWNELSIKGELANFAFGQGELLMTPIQMLKAYHVLATGNLIAPSVIYGYMDSSGSVNKSTVSLQHKLLTDYTVEKLCEMLVGVIENGNAYNAGSEILSAGKTGTAQSGIYSEGEEICRTWFSGFFPAEAPKYIVVVMNENGVGGNNDCGPVFRYICEKISEYE